MTDDLADRLEVAAAAAVAALRKAMPARDWLDELDAGGDALKIDEAGYIIVARPILCAERCMNTRETIRSYKFSLRPNL